MLYFDFEAGGEVYRLRLNTRSLVTLEAQLGKNPLMIFQGGELPLITEMCAVLHASMQELNHGVTMDKVYKIFDAYLDEGHTPAEFIGVILEVYKVSGLLEREGKN